METRAGAGCGSPFTRAASSIALFFSWSLSQRARRTTDPAPLDMVENFVNFRPPSADDTPFTGRLRGKAFLAKNDLTGMAAPMTVRTEREGV